MKSLLHESCQTEGPKPQFFTASKGPLFTLSIPAQGPHQGTFIYIPPFAEEANKSRRMAALQGRSLSKMGYDVILLDLYGTGDSQGDFQEGDWPVWKADIKLVVEQLVPKGPLSFWGLRMGCLLIADFLQDHPMEVKNCLFWQPVSLGQQLVTQFLRLEMANTMQAEEKITPKILRQRLQQGESVEVAGYRLNANLIAQLDELKLLDIQFTCQQLYWIELVKQAGKTISPVADKILQQWRSQIPGIQSHSVVGDSFWATQEIATAPALLECSQSVLGA